MFTEYLKYIGEQRDARAEQNQTNRIERVDMSSSRKIGQVQIDHQQPRQANRNIYEKNETPVEVSDDKATGNRSEHWADQCWNGDEAHHAYEFGLRKCSD